MQTAKEPPSRAVAHAHVPQPITGVRPARISHVVLRSHNVDRMIEWYCLVLNAQVVLRHRIISFITWDGAHDRLAFMPVAADKELPPPPAGIDHVAFELESLADLAATYRRLEPHQIHPYLAVNHGVATSLYYRDPDGNQMELTVDNFDSTELLNRWLDTGAFDVNPVGVVLDPIALVERIEAADTQLARFNPEPNHLTWLAEQRRG